jgi:hypothetical protein
MSEAKLLLNAYYEALYERLESARSFWPQRIEELLAREVEKRGWAEIQGDKRAAYADAANAFVEERIESYNPIGVHHTFAPIGRRAAFDLEAQLDWYDSQAEFKTLWRAVQQRAEAGMSAERLGELAGEIIGELGAYPDKSIVAGYESGPTLNKLPDYIAAQVIEEAVRRA